MQSAVTASRPGRSEGAPSAGSASSARSLARMEVDAGSSRAPSEAPARPGRLFRRAGGRGGDGDDGDAPPDPNRLPPAYGIREPFSFSSELDAEDPEELLRKRRRVDPAADPSAVGVEWLNRRAEQAASATGDPYYEFFQLVAGFSNQSIESVLASDDGSLEERRRARDASVARLEELKTRADIEVRQKLLERILASDDLEFSEVDGRVVVESGPARRANKFARALAARAVRAGRELAAAPPEAASAAPGAGAGSGSAPAPSQAISVERLVESVQTLVRSIDTRPPEEVAPPRAQFLQRPDVGGLYGVKPIVRASVYAAHEKIRTRSAQAGVTLDELMTEGALRTLFAQLVALQMTITRSMAPSRYMPESTFVWTLNQERAILQRFRKLRRVGGGWAFT